MQTYMEKTNMANVYIPRVSQHIAGGWAFSDSPSCKCAQSELDMEKHMFKYVEWIFICSSIML